MLLDEEETSAVEEAGCGQGFDQRNAKRVTEIVFDAAIPSTRLAVSQHLISKAWDDEFWTYRARKGDHHQ